MDGGASGVRSSARAGHAVTWWVTAVCVLLGLFVGFAVATRWWASPEVGSGPVRGWRRIDAPGARWSLEVPGAPGAARDLELATVAGGRRMRTLTTAGPPLVEVGVVQLVADDRAVELHGIADAYLAATRSVAGTYDRGAAPFDASGTFTGRRGATELGGVVVASGDSALLVVAVGDTTAAGEALLRVVDSIRAGS